MNDHEVSSPTSVTVHTVLSACLILMVAFWSLTLLDWGYRLFKGGLKELESQLIHVMFVVFGGKYATLKHAVLFEAAILGVTAALFIGFLSTRTRQNSVKSRGQSRTS